MTERVSAGEGAPDRGRIVRQTLRRAAVLTVKPLVSDAAWQRLRSAGRTTPAAGPPPEPPRWQVLQQMSLTELAQEFRTDKWGTHRYTPHYERHLAHLRDEEFTMLEIGIGGYARERQGGASLRMWKHYFRRAQVLGLDIADKSFVDQKRIRTYQGSQADEALLHRIAEEAGELKVVVDDGSHRPEHIRATFRVLFPLLADGGVYAIEDTQTSYWPEWGGSEDRHDPTTTMALVKDLLDGLNFEEFVDESYQPSYTDLHVVGVHAYHNLVIIEKGDNREGTNRRRVLRRRYEGTEPPA
jgi:demethylmacrocin O-methyltransferase